MSTRMKTRGFAKALMLGTAVATIAAVASPSVAATAFQERSSRVRLNIPAQGLGSALTEFARQSGQQLLYSPELVAGRRSSAVAGELTPREGLIRLLTGTGLGLRTAPSGAFLLSDAGMPSPQGEAQAGGAPADSESAEGRDIVVTGTNIRGVPPASPVHIITRNDIDQSGYSQVGDVMRALPQNSPGGINPGIVSSPNANNVNLTNASSVNLRGLGPTATLVLVNRRRLASDGEYSAPDISAIPLAAIQRIEVLTDGSSAIYGSDAVAGVVNFILRRNYNGAEFSARVGVATRGGGFEQTYNAMAGTSWQTGHLLGGAEYQNQEPILASQRAFTREAGANTLIAGQERQSYFLSAALNVAPWVNIHLDGFYAHRLANRTTEYEPDGYTDYASLDAKSIMLAPGISFQLPENWNATIAGTISRATNDSDDVDSFGDTYEYDVRNASRAIELNVDGALLSLPSGDVRLALGAGYREIESRASSIQFLRIGQRHMRFAYGELFLPIVSPLNSRPAIHSLDLSIAARFEDYSDFGRTTNPKIGIRYAPVEGLTLRGTWGTSFKAPPFLHMIAANVLTLWQASTFGSSRPGTAIYSFGGNPDLKPERSTSWTLGLDWSPSSISGLEVAFTYFRTRYTDRIVSPITSQQTALSDPSNLPFIIQNPSPTLQAELISNASAFVNISGMPYNPATVIAIVDSRFVNASIQEISGIDLSISKSFQLNSGSIEIFSNGSFLNIDQQTTSSLPSTRRTGTIFNPSELRIRAGVTWNSGNLIVTSIVNYVSGGVDNLVTPQASISSWTTLDLNVTYNLPRWSEGINGLQVSLSIVNALDQEPPYALGGEAGLVGIRFDSSNSSPIGRFVAVTLRQRF